MDFTNLKQFLDRMVDISFAPGAAVCVYKDGKKVLKYATGLNSIEKQTPLTGDELFFLYSCSKNVTVTAAMQLLEKGYFNMNDPLYYYIPEFRHMNIKNKDGSIVEAKNPILIRHLFTMTAGFSYDFTQPGYVKARELTDGKMNTDVVTRCAGENFLSFEPGTHWQYSTCHDILAGFVEIVSGMRFRDYVNANIFRPCGMKDSYYHFEAVKDRIAEQYLLVEPEGNISDDLVELQMSAGGFSTKSTFKNVGIKNSHILGPEYDSGGAGIISSIDDYALFLAALANRGTSLIGERIIAPKTIDLLRTNTLTPELMKDYIWSNHAGCGYGYGVRVHLDRAKSGVNSSLGEFGWGGAAGATTIIDPEENLAVMFVQHKNNPREDWYQQRLRNVVYSCL